MPDEYSKGTQTLVRKTTDTWINQRTGEAIEADTIVKKAYGAKAFWKLYLLDFMQVLGVLDSKQVDVLVYIAENTQPGTNLFMGTQNQIAEAVGVSRPTVSRVFKKLTEANFIQRKFNGVWLVNPNIIMKGNDFKRKQIMIEYKNLSADNQKEGGETEAVNVSEYTLISPVIEHTDQLSKTMVEAGQQEFVKETVVREE